MLRGVYCAATVCRVATACRVATVRHAVQQVRNRCAHVDGGAAEVAALERVGKRLAQHTRMRTHARRRTRTRTDTHTR